ncbi:MAG TPA: gamma-glutamyltransferase [Xanthomonadales bacterium]|nr:gamma-glutamyltransferase [Xanthomonadales bacterium]
MTHQRRWLLCLSLVVTGPVGAASVAPVAADNGMVVTAQHLATDVGVDVLRAGGNAGDAAVAVGYALAVVYPAAGNIGGGGFMTLHLADGRDVFIDFRERAPLASTADMFLDANGNPDAKRSTRGHLAVGVPGTVAGLELAREKYGTLPRKRLVAPAIALAENGFVLDAGDLAMFVDATADLMADPASRAIFFADGRPLRVGDRIRQKDLARTLRAISRGGVDGFYRGDVAQRLVKASKDGGGIITHEDLQQYRAVERAPIHCAYRGYTIVAPPPPSSGGVTMCEMLRILEGYPLAEYGWGSADAAHVTIEAMRHAYADRNRFLGDPAFVDNPVARLLSDEHVAQIRTQIEPQHAGDSSKLAPELQRREGTHTTHYSIADRFGNVASVTYTLNDWFGARVTAPGTGIVLNNEMDDFTSKPGTPNLYGLVQGEANAIAGGKRPLSSMTPTIVLRNGEPVAALGTPGGSTIITTVLHAVLNLVDYRMDVQEAVDAPRFHHQWLPDETAVEARALSPDTRRLLEAWGYRLVAPQEPNHLAAILVGGPALDRPTTDGPRFYGANDPRRGTGLARGY